MEKSNGRQRVRFACGPCHKRKRRCDNKRPCAMCTTYGYTCDSDQPPELTSPTSGSTTTTNARHPTSPAHRRKIQKSKHGSAASSVKENESPCGSNEHSGPGGSATCTQEPGLLNAQKARFVSASSVIAFPRVLALDVESPNPHELHSYGYNMGVRQEEGPSEFGHLSQFIKEEELRTYSDVYFSVMAPILQLLDEDLYRQRCRQYYRGEHPDATFGALAAGVAAIGSLMSYNNGHAHELDIVKFARNILDSPSHMIRVSVDLLVCWCLRGFYLRATTRPLDGWMASNTAVHLCEAIGLHKEENLTRTAQAVNLTEDRLRWIFWTTWSFNQLISYEYGRSSVTLPRVTCENVTEKPGLHAHQFIYIAQTIPSINSPFQLGGEFEDSESEVERLSQRIRALERIGNIHPFIVLTKAEISFCFYRRLYQLRTPPKQDVAQLIIQAGIEAVASALRVVGEVRPLFNALGAVFQFICVLLALDTTASLSHLASTFSALEEIVTVFDTWLTREALTTARHLLRDFKTRKRRQYELMDAISLGDQQISTEPWDAPPDASIFPNLDLDLDLGAFLEHPFYY